MKGVVDNRNSTAVYALVTIGLLICFAAGIYVGRTFFREATPETIARADQPDVDIHDLDFYDDLVKDDEKNSPAKPADPGIDGGAPALGSQPSTPPETSVRTLDSSTPTTRRSSDVSRSAPDPGLDIKDGFTVQLGAVNNKQDAGKILDRLRQKGYQGILVNPGFIGDRYYRVWVGKFASREEAVEMSQRLKGDQFDTFVKRAQFPPDS